MLSNFVLLPSDKVSNYIVTLGGYSMASCAAVKDLGVIIDLSLLFETHVDNITRIALFDLRNIVTIGNM